jgi:hypothetical protein
MPITRMRSLASSMVTMVIASVVGTSKRRAEPLHRRGT